MTKQVNKTSKKEDIWEAYTELLEQLEAKQNENPVVKQEKEQQKETVAKASALSSEKIINEIAALKNNLSETMDKLEQAMIQEFRNLETIRKAIEIEQKKLQEMYNIQAHAQSLTALITLQKEKKEAFEKEIMEEKAALEQEMTEKRALWKKEQEEMDKKIKETKAELEKQRKREEEEYLYNLTLQRKKENDAYLEKQAQQEKMLAEQKAAFEKSIAEREAALAASENELNELRKKAAAFPAELEAAVKAAEARITEKLTAQFEFEKQLNAKQIEGEMKLKDQTIATLKEKIKDLETSLKEYIQKAVQAEASVKDIALKAIESSSKLKIIETNNKTSEK